MARLLGSSRRGLPCPSGALRNGGLSLARSRRGSAPHSSVDACAQGRPPGVCAFLCLVCAHQPQYEQVPAAQAPWLHGPHISSIPRRSHSVASIFCLIGTRSPALCLLTVSARAPLHLSLPSIDVDDHDPSLRPEALRSPFSCIAHSRAARLLRAQGCGKLFPRRFAGKLFLGPAGNLDARDDAVPSPRPKTTGGARRNVGDVNREAAGASREPKG